MRTDISHHISARCLSALSVCCNSFLYQIINNIEMWHLHFEFTLYLCQLYPIIILSIVEAHICPINAGQSHVGLKVVHLSKRPYELFHIDSSWCSWIPTRKWNMLENTEHKTSPNRMLRPEKNTLPNIYQPFTKFQRSNFPLASKTPRSSTSQPQVLHVEGSVRAAGLQKRLFPWPRRSTQICYMICIF